MRITYGSYSVFSFSISSIFVSSLKLSSVQWTGEEAKRGGYVNQGSIDKRVLIHHVTVRMLRFISAAGRIPDTEVRER